MGEMRFRGRQRGLSAASAQVLGLPVTVAVPIQRRDPAVVLAVSLLELVVFGLWLATVSALALAATAAAAGALAVMRVTDRRKVVAITPTGCVLLAASPTGRPLAAAGAAPRELRLPEPTGLRAPLTLEGRRWYVERQHFPRLIRAREALAAAPTGGGW